MDIWLHLAVILDLWTLVMCWILGRHLFCVLHQRTAVKDAVYWDQIDGFEAAALNRKATQTSRDIIAKNITVDQFKKYLNELAAELEEINDRMRLRGKKLDWLVENERWFAMSLWYLPGKMYKINWADPSKPYSEYRGRFVKD